jgi:hypothetical protein
LCITFLVLLAAGIWLCVIPNGMHFESGTVMIATGILGNLALMLFMPD